MKAKIHKVKNAKLERVYKKINQHYQSKVQPIFKRFCVDCHSDRPNLPWYYKIKGIKGEIDKDIKEGTRHLNFTAGFPFKSHASPIEDLNSVRKSIEKGSMPPLKYILLNPSAYLSGKEKKVILNWVTYSLKLIIDQGK